MPSGASSSGDGQRSKPSTRSSIRQSLNLASMGKALVDVMNKDGRDSDKGAKKAKDNSSPRSSAVHLQSGVVPRTSMGENTSSQAQALKRGATSDSKTVTRRRASTAAQKSSSDECAAKPSDTIPPQAVGVTRSSSIRPRNPATSSALPKYRPKSTATEAAKKPPSPARAGTRRRLSSSDEDKEDRKEQRKPKVSSSPSEKVAPRPISPLPHRAALKVNLTSAINAPPSTPPSKTKSVTPSSSKSSPVRPTKTIKTTSSTSATQPVLPRPPSSASSSSVTSRTPRSPALNNVSGYRRLGREKSIQEPSPTRSSSRHIPESPLSRQSRKGSRSVHTPESAAVGMMSHISEGNSEDSFEVNDVELLLAPVASLAVPTPAMPRLRISHTRQLPRTQTPSPTNLPARANLSYLSPLPPDSNSPLSLRSQRQHDTDRPPRGSILSWEQLATEASRTLGEGEIDSMLSDIPAPFRSSSGSPVSGPVNTDVNMDVPESPCLSTMNSPGAYGSISQVLLPDVTPSPAVHHLGSQKYDSMSTEVPAVDAAVVTLLRLQLASVENTAKERLFRLQSMEEEIHDLKEARFREAEELTQEVAFLEDKVRGNIEARDRGDEERSAYTASLEDRLRHAEAFRDQAVEIAVAKAQQSAQASRDAALRSWYQKWEVACVARAAAMEWTSARVVAESELDIVKGDRDVLLVLLSQLEHARKQIDPQNSSCIHKLIS